MFNTVTALPRTHEQHHMHGGSSFWHISFDEKGSRTIDTYAEDQRILWHLWKHIYLLGNESQTMKNHMELGTCSHDSMTSFHQNYGSFGKTKLVAMAVMEIHSANIWQSVLTRILLIIMF